MTFYYAHSKSSIKIRLLFFAGAANKHFTILIIKRFHWLSRNIRRVMWLNWCVSHLCRRERERDRERQEPNRTRKKRNVTFWIFTWCLCAPNVNKSIPLKRHNLIRGSIKSQAKTHLRRIDTLFWGGKTTHTMQKHFDNGSSIFQSHQLCRPLHLDCFNGFFPRTLTMASPMFTLRRQISGVKWRIVLVET